eukprot:352865-Chlamydomonas_euryale.AAC.13
MTSTRSIIVTRGAGEARRGAAWRVARVLAAVERARSAATRAGCLLPSSGRTCSLTRATRCHTRPRGHTRSSRDISTPGAHPRDRPQESSSGAHPRDPPQQSSSGAHFRDPPQGSTPGLHPKGSIPRGPQAAWHTKGPHLLSTHPAHGRRVSARGSLRSLLLLPVHNMVASYKDAQWSRSGLREA